MIDMPSKPPDKSEDNGILELGKIDVNNITKQPIFISSWDKNLGLKPIVLGVRVDLVAKKLAQVEHVKGNNFSQCYMFKKL